VSLPIAMSVSSLFNDNDKTDPAILGISNVFTLTNSNFNFLVLSNKFDR
jgi:hypothetical protein